MKSIQNQYRDLKEGKMSQTNFMRNLRMTMPQYVTNVTSFNDAVKILKNKAILTEAALGENNLLDELESEIENGNSYAEAIAKVAAKYNIDEDTLATKYPEEAVGNKAYADNYAEPVDDSDVDWTNEDKDEDDEIEAMVKKMEAEKEGEEAIMSQFDPMEEELNEKSYKVSKDAISVSSLKKGDILGGSGLEVVSISAGAKTPSGKIEVTVKDPKTGNEVTKVWNKATKVTVKKDLKEAKKKKETKAELHPNQIHPQELRMGIKVELEHTDDLDKAKKIALDHLAENPFYYTALKLSGIESPSVFTAKPPVKKGKKKETIQLVDLANQMKKVKMPKAEEKKKLKEARYNIIGEPNAAAVQAMQFVDGNNTLKALSDDIEIQQTSNPNEALLRYQYWDALPAEAVEKLKLQFDVERDGDFDEDTGEIIFYRLTPKKLSKSGFRPGVDLGASFEKFKSQLEEIVRETLAEMQSDDQEIDDMAMAMDEYFDGRNNLADEIAAQQK